MKMYNLCYIKNSNDEYLMLYRNKKENDINEGKWVGIGGKIEENETIHESMYREIKEETNLKAIKLELRGIVNFEYNNNLDIIYVFTCDNYKGKLGKCDEGELKFIKKELVLNLELWEGDKYFLKHILENDEEFFVYKMRYKGDKLIEVIKEN